MSGPAPAVVPNSTGRSPRYCVDNMLKGRMKRGPASPRHPAAPKNPGDAAPSSANRLLPGQAGYPLSCALSYLRRTSETTVGSLAFLTGASASYIYRITSGERTPTWEVTQRFAIACETEPEDLMFLWNRAHSLEAPPARRFTESVRTLRAALRGLYLAASSPDLARLRKSAFLPPLQPRSSWPPLLQLTATCAGRWSGI